MVRLIMMGVDALQYLWKKYIQVPREPWLWHAEEMGGRDESVPKKDREGDAI